MVGSGVVSVRARPVMAVMIGLLLVVSLVVAPTSALAEPWVDVGIEVDPPVAVADGQQVITVTVTVIRLEDNSPVPLFSVALFGFDGQVVADDETGRTGDDGRVVFELSTTVVGEQQVEVALAGENPLFATVTFEAADDGSPDVDDGRLFSDVPADHTFAEEVAWLASTGITLGRSDGSFGLNDAVTRGAMAAFLYRFDGEPEGPFDAPSFDDVPDGHVFAQEIAWLASTGITQGRGDGSFGLNDPVTRGAMAAFLYRYDQHQDGEAPASTP